MIDEFVVRPEIREAFDGIAGHGAAYRNMDLQIRALVADATTEELAALCIDNRYYPYDEWFDPKEHRNGAWFGVPLLEAIWIKTAEYGEVLKPFLQHRANRMFGIGYMRRYHATVFEETFLQRAFLDLSSENQLKAIEQVAQSEAREDGEGLHWDEAPTLMVEMFFTMPLKEGTLADYQRHILEASVSELEVENISAGLRILGMLIRQGL